MSSRPIALIALSVPYSDNKRYNRALQPWVSDRLARVWQFLIETSSVTAASVFVHCVQAIRRNALIQRVSTTDKEFHFQNWFEARLKELGLRFDRGGRNSYPDFRMVATTDGFELKGLAYPGRD